MYTLPRRIYELVPYVVFVGALIGLGVLSNNSELTVLRSAGVSLSRIFIAVTLPVLLVVVIAVLIGEFVAPRGERIGEAIRVQAQQATETISMGRGGYWHREGGLYTHVDGLGGNESLVGVRQYQLDADRNMVLTRKAGRARYDTDQGLWILNDVVETRFDANRTVTNTFDEVRWRSHTDPRLLSARVLVEPNKLSISDLMFQVAYLDREGLSSGRYRVAMWSKVFQPLAVLGLVLVAVGFVVGPLREVSMGLRLTVGIVVGLVFKYMQDLFAPMTLVYDVPAWLAVLIPIAACWVCGGILLRRAS
jgi:lipopolysaccharide export system permease protein